MLGVEPVTDKKALDKFGHLKDSDTNIQAQGFDDMLRYMKKMGVQIAYQKETLIGKDFKSNLKKRIGAKSRGLNVRWNLEGLDVKDENTTKKLSQNENYGDGSQLKKHGESSNDSDTFTDPSLIVGATNNEGNPSQVSGTGESTESFDKFGALKNNEHADGLKYLEDSLHERYTTFRKVKKPESGNKQNEATPISKKKKRQLQMKQEMYALGAEEKNPDYETKHNSDEEIKNLKKIAAKKEKILYREKEKVSDLMAQQMIASDYQKGLNQKKEFFVEIASKDKKPKKSFNFSSPEDTIKSMVKNLDKINGKTEFNRSNSPRKRTITHKRKKSVYDLEPLDNN